MPLLTYHASTSPTLAMSWKEKGAAVVWHCSYCGVCSYFMTSSPGLLLGRQRDKLRSSCAEVMQCDTLLRHRRGLYTSALHVCVNVYFR